MNRIVRTLLLAAMAAWLPPAFAQPAAGELEAAWAEFDAAADVEKRAIAAQDAAFAAARERERATNAAVREDLLLRNAQVAELQRIEREISSTLDRIEALIARPQQLLLEKALLENWYALLGPVVPHLTPTSFRTVEAEVAALAGAGLVEPGARRFRSYAELRARITVLGNRLTADKEARRAQATSLRTRYEALRAQRQRAMEAFGQANPALDAAAVAWFEPTQDFERHVDAVREARARLEPASRRVLEAAASLRPPILSSVSATVAGSEIYRATWRSSDGSAASEPGRKAKRDLLVAEREDLIQKIAMASAIQRDQAAARLAAVEKMHRVGQAVSRSADRYREKLIRGADTAVVLDIGTTIAEIILTGGAATMVRKTAEIAETAAARAAARKASAAAGPPVYTALSDEAIAAALRPSARAGVRGFEAEVDKLAAELMAKGMRKEAAEALALREVQALNARLANASRATKLAADVKAGLESQMEVDLATVLGNAGVAEGLAVTGTGVILQEVVTPPSGAFLEVHTAQATAFSEKIEFGLSAVGSVVTAPAASASAAQLTRLQQLAAKGVNANLPGLALGALGGALKVYSAQQLDKSINDEAHFYARQDAELTVLWAAYRVGLEDAAKIDAELAELRGAQAKNAAELKLLDAGPVLEARPMRVQVAEDGQLEVELGFSAPLLSAPDASVAGKPLALQRTDATGQRWRGSLPVKALGPGEHPLSVRIGKTQNLHGSLDSDPATPARRLTRRELAWSGFEQGADTRHVLPLLLRTAPTPTRLAAAPEEDPFEAGRALVEEGRALVDGGGAPVASSSSPHVPPPEAPSDEGCNPRTGNFRRIAGTAEILAGGFGYRDTHPDTFNIGLDLSDMPNGDVIVCVALGQGASSGSFVLSDAAARDRILASVGDVRPGRSGSMRFHFDAPLRIAFRGQGNWFSERGARNSISYVVVVRGTNAATTRAWAKPQGEATFDANNAAAAAPATAKPPVVPPGPCRGFSGRWSTSYGPMTLRASSSQIEGSYNFLGNGSLRGTVAGNVLDARWQDSTGTGSLRFQLAADGRSFSGRWTRESGNGNPQGAWSGTCQSP